MDIRVAWHLAVGEKGRKRSGTAKQTNKQKKKSKQNKTKQTTKQNKN